MDRQRMTKRRSRRQADHLTPMRLGGAMPLILRRALPWMQAPLSALAPRLPMLLGPELRPPPGMLAS